MLCLPALFSARPLRPREKTSFCANVSFKFSAGSPVNNVAPQQPPQQQSLSSSLLALRPTVPHLTPSLGNYYRDELTNHIKNWPVHPIEKQVIKLSEEIHGLTSIHCTRVSSELKTARAVVRHNEIQATLQEQR